MFVPGKPFQPSLMFAGKAGAYARVEHLKGASLGKLRTRNKMFKIFKHTSLFTPNIELKNVCSTRFSSYITRKDNTRIEMLGGLERSSLFTWRLLGYS